MTQEDNGPPQICGARHPRGHTNVGPCQIYGEHDAHLFPHRAIAEGAVEIGFDTVNQRPIFGHRRWWREWYDEPRAEWPRGLYEWPRLVPMKECPPDMIVPESALLEAANTPEFRALMKRGLLE